MGKGNDFTSFTIRHLNSSGEFDSTELTVWSGSDPWPNHPQSELRARMACVSVLSLSSVFICLEPSLGSPGATDFCRIKLSSDCLAAGIFFSCSFFPGRADKKQFRGARLVRRHNTPVLAVSSDETTSAVPRYDHTHPNTEMRQSC